MAQCMTPFYKKQKNEEDIPLPCGRCPPCTARRVSGWSFRLMQQEKIATSAVFLTLTYDPENCPISEKKFMNLDKRDLQLFFKRLRKKNEKKIKYYACGEYGGKTNRPHYHLIIFDVDVETIESSWGLGQIHIGDVNGASIGYCLKYINKPNRIPLFYGDDRQKEFSLMSKGIGANYITDAVKRWHLADLGNRMICVTLDGVKLSMPRYYKNKIYGDEKSDFRPIAAASARAAYLERLAREPIKTERDLWNENQAKIAAFRRASINSLKNNLI